jgi:D-alanine-D-alanine ligase
VIWFNRPSADAPLDSVDVLAQVESIGRALEGLGYTTHQIPFSLDFEGLRRQLRELSPSFVVNLVESVEEDGSLIHLAPAMLEFFGVRYTGCPAQPMYLTTNKLLAKRAFLSFGIPTPPWLSRTDSHLFEDGMDYIVKAVGEDASIGLDDSSIVTGMGRAALVRLLEERTRKSGREQFAERFIEGREFNIAMLGGYGSPQLLPIAEILFPAAWAHKKHKILDYRSKWDETSEAFHTDRRFDFPDRDQPALAAIRSAAELCWNRLGFKGYARADFRVDAQGRPWLLEVNPNPGIAPDSGFVAAVRHAGLEFEDVIARLAQLA